MVARCIQQFLQFFAMAEKSLNLRLQKFAMAAQPMGLWARLLSMLLLLLVFEIFASSPGDLLHLLTALLEQLRLGLSLLLLLLFVIEFFAFSAGPLCDFLHFFTAL